jgi:hypothetical protein
MEVTIKEEPIVERMVTVTMPRDVFILLTRMVGYTSNHCRTQSPFNFSSAHAAKLGTFYHKVANNSDFYPFVKDKPKTDF